MSRANVVFLPGTLCDASLFAPQIVALSDIADCTVGNLSASDTLAGVAEDVLAQAPEQFALVGLSYGGIVAFEIMRRAPQRILKLALLNTTPDRPSPETVAKQQRFLTMAHPGEFRDITTDFLKDAMLHPDHRRDAALREQVLNMALNIGIDGFTSQVRAQLSRPDSTPDLPHIACPTLVLTGREDMICTVAQHEKMARLIPDSRLVIVEHCGHLSTLEQPDTVSAALREWLLTEQETQYES